MTARPFAGTRATAHRPRRALDDAAATLEAFAARRASSPWRTDREAVARRLRTLVARPDLLQQRRLNLCGPAAFLRAWAKHDPAAFARFASTLYDTGRAQIGDLAIAPGPLADTDHASLADRHGRGIPEPADWMLLGALRASENRLTTFRGRPEDALSAMTFPSELVRWLRATGLYADITDRTTPLVPSSLAAALVLAPSPTTDVFVLVNLHVLRELRQPSGRRRAASFLLRAFPDHWAALVAPITPLPDDRLALRLWSWGTILEGDVPRETFRANWYGAIVATIDGAG